MSDLAEDFGESYCEALLGFHVFTGEDTTSAFQGKGKINPLKRMLKKPRFQNTFQNLGKELVPCQKLIEELEEFTCEMYGYPRVKQVNKVRSLMLNKMVGGSTDNLTKKSKVDLSKLPPCKSSFKPHVDRSNYKCILNKSSHIAKPELPSPTGWRAVEDFLEPVWSEGPILPASLVDLITEDSDNDDEDSDDDDDETYSSSDDSSEEESDDE